MIILGVIVFKIFPIPAGVDPSNERESAVNNDVEYEDSHSNGESLIHPRYYIILIMNVYECNGKNIFTK